MSLNDFVIDNEPDVPRGIYPLETLARSAA